MGQVIFDVVQHQKHLQVAAVGVSHRKVLEKKHSESRVVGLSNEEGMRKMKGIAIAMTSKTRSIKKRKLKKNPCSLADADQ